MPAVYGIERERYEYTVDVNGKPKACVRPLSGTFEDNRTIVEGSDPGTGKTHALCDLIKEDHTATPSAGSDSSDDESDMSPDDGELGMDSDDTDGATDVSLRAAEHGDKVLVVLHRVELCKKIHADLNRFGLGFELYSELPNGMINCSRLVVCVNSLWRIAEREWDLIAIDETPEVIKAVCLLENKGHSCLSCPQLSCSQQCYS
jgi:hypothetical protein